MLDKNSYNKIILVGHIGRDPEIRYTPDNRAVANISLATTEFMTKPNGEREDRTQWHNIVAWGKLAEFGEKYLKKGMQIMVEGKLRYDNWTAQDGTKRKSARVYADKIILLGKRDRNDYQSNDNLDSGFGDSSGDLPDGSDEGLPF